MSEQSPVLGFAIFSYTNSINIPAVIEEGNAFRSLHHIALLLVL
jgi:hypothetical protein